MKYLSEDRETRVTFQIRTLPDKELWYQAVVLPHNMKNIIPDILCTEGFEQGDFMVEIKPYNPETDEDIHFRGLDHRLDFLGKRTPLT